MSITITPIPAFNDNYIWLVINQNKKQALCVDPGDAKPLLQYLEQKDLSLRAVLITHHHFDHINGLTELLKTFPKLQVWAPEDQRIPHPCHRAIPAKAITINTFPGSFEVLSTPGHTKPHLCYFNQELEALFCGDTLFSAGCGRLFEGTAKEMLNSLKTLKELPRTTKIYPAHEYTEQNLRFASHIEPDNQAIEQALTWSKITQCTLPSTLEKECEINPFLRSDRYVQHLPVALEELGSNTTEEIVFQTVREMKDNF
jgi:hydroxyacylglutathione hydrolase